MANGCTPSPDAAILADRVLELEVNLGFGGGVNRGALEVSRRLICVMNDDAFFIDDTPARLVRAAAAGKIVGPFSNESKFPQGAVDPRRVPDASIPTDMVVGVCMMMATDLFRRLEGFDTRLNTWEDDDICLRARRLGVTCEVVGGAYVHHEGGATFRAQAVDVQAIMQRNARVFRRVHPTIGVIAIAKDEAHAIEGFYRQFESVTRNWFLLDTGSSDDTGEVARRLGVRVATCVFEDFAHARNVALDTFRREIDWIVMLDPGRAARLAFDSTPRSAGRQRRTRCLSRPAARRVAGRLDAAVRSETVPLSVRRRAALGLQGAREAHWV